MMAGKVVTGGIGGAGNEAAGIKAAAVEMAAWILLKRRPHRLLGMVVTVGMRRRTMPEKCRPKRWL